MTKASTSKPRRWPRRVLIGTIAFIVIFSVSSMIIVKQVYDNNFTRAEDSEYSAYYKYSDIADDYLRQQVSFMSGDNRLVGYIYNEQSETALVVISHGLGGGADSYLAEIMMFVDAGYRVFAFDNTGSFASEGETTKGLAQSVIDLDAAFTYIENDSELSTLPILLYGHSWGGYAATAVLNYDHPAVAASVSVAGYNSPIEMLYEQASSMMGFFATIEYPYLWAYQRFLFGSAASLTAVDGINSSGIPVMIIHGTQDRDISISGAGIMAQRNKITNPNAEFFIRDQDGMNGHNNLFISPESAAYIKEKNIYWSALYEQYKGNIPESVRAEYYNSLDKELTTQLDPEYCEAVLGFYARSLGN